MSIHTGELDLERWKPFLTEDKPNVVYILRLCNDGLYIGSTTDFYQRMKDHQDRLGAGARLTRKTPAVAVVYVECFETYLHARHREEQIKGWTRAKKEALISGHDFELMRLSFARQPRERRHY